MTEQGSPSDRSLSPTGEVDESKRATLRRFAALGAASPLTRFINSDDGTHGESAARDAIAGYLTATPGAHFSKIRDDLQLGNGETQHHLRQLVSANAIESYRDGDYRRFYPAGRFDSYQKVALGYLRRETPRGMLLYLLREPEVTGTDLAASLDVSRPTISKYAATLEEVGILSREDGYAVVEPEVLITLFVRYADSFGPDAVAFAAEAHDLLRYDP